MNVCLRFALAFGLFLPFTHTASAQLSPPSVDSVQTRLQSVTILGNHSETDVSGAPFSAIEESLYSRKQPDGGYHDRSSITTYIYRDNQGRTRAERYTTSYLPDAGKPRLQSVFVADPVAGVLYRLDPENQTAMRMLCDTSTRTASERPSGAEVVSQVTTESLGPNTVEGLRVEGTRQTLTVPAEARDDHQPYVVVIERWISPDLQVTVLSTRNTRGGRRTTRLTKISRSEPAAALFSVPSDYKIEDAPTVEGVVSGATP